MELDEVFPVRNLFWLGNYSNAIDEAQDIQPKNDRERIDRDVFVYRSHIALGEASKVLDAVGDQASASTDVLAVKLFAQYKSQPQQREAVQETLKEWLSDETSRDNRTVQLMAGLIFLAAGDVKEALRSLRVGGNLEICALKVQIYLGMNRLDMANKELDAMKNLEEDCDLTQLASARVALATGGESVKEAMYIFEEKMDQTSPNPMLLNGLAACHMQLKRFGEAQKPLEEALKLAPADVETLVNLVSCYANLRKPEKDVQALLDKLKAASPDHPILAQLAQCDATFDKVAAEQLQKSATA